MLKLEPMRSATTGLMGLYTRQTQLQCVPRKAKNMAIRECPNVPNFLTQPCASSPQTNPVCARWPVAPLVIQIVIVNTSTAQSD